MNIPAIQKDHTKNLAVTVHEDQVVLGETASCWLPHTPGNLPKDSTYNESKTVSLELLNSDGYYMIQRDYKFVLEKYNSSSDFGMRYCSIKTNSEVQIWHPMPLPLP